MARKPNNRMPFIMFFLIICMIAFFYSTCIFDSNIPYGNKKVILKTPYAVKDTIHYYKVEDGEKWKKHFLIGLRNI